MKKKREIIYLHKNLRIAPILRKLKKIGDQGINHIELAMIMGVNTATLYDKLNKLAELGEVERVDDNWYYIPE